MYQMFTNPDFKNMVSHERWQILTQQSIWILTSMVGLYYVVYGPVNMDEALLETKRLLMSFRPIDSRLGLSVSVLAKIDYEYIV